MGGEGNSKESELQGSGWRGMKTSELYNTITYNYVCKFYTRARVHFAVRMSTC